SHRAFVLDGPAGHGDDIRGIRGVGHGAHEVFLPGEGPPGAAKRDDIVEGQLGLGFEYFLGDGH
ncbi:hypothetical protein, partial [Thermodesulfatator autotrophicus]|uniref:hypothetical protein n=1 Tax=Thermodesulfatator autotrophicus TaxID=1795632 RepID=UPI0018D31233